MTRLSPVLAMSSNVSCGQPALSSTEPDHSLLPIRWADSLFSPIPNVSYYH